jgi:Rrf2 family transcriptional regulator, cysteine metabolism repressor
MLDSQTVEVGERFCANSCACSSKGNKKMKLSRTVSYALQAVIQLAQTGSNSPVPCSRLATTGKMPERFLLQILRSLVTHGILHSTRGVEGGYTLDRKPEHISLLQIIEAIEGPLNPKMMLNAELDVDLQSRLNDALETITRSTREMLDQVKLSALVANDKVAVVA